MKKTKEQLKAELTDVLLPRMSGEPRTHKEVIDQVVDLLVDFFDERITKIEKATGFMGIGT